MKSSTTISVIMPVFNTEFYLIKRAINSVLNQDFQDFELIIIDDGSDNDAENKLLVYVKQLKNKITYLYHKNIGQSQSVNKAVSIATGKFITFLDSDDKYKPNHLSSCLLEMKHADLIASNTQTIVDKEEDYFVPDKHDPSKLVHVDDCTLFATLFGKKEIFENLKFQDKYGADSTFYEEATKKYIVKKVNLRTYIYYRNTSNSISAKLKRFYSTTRPT